jgi:hypothetical protein
MNDGIVKLQESGKRAERKESRQKNGNPDKNATQ